jgi:hypothetical protein
MPVSEINTYCVIHGKADTRHCAACDSDAGIDRDMWTGFVVSPEQKRARVVDALREAGLSLVQVDLVMKTLAEDDGSGSTRNVSDAQLTRVLDSLAGRASTAAAVSQGVLTQADDTPAKVDGSA